MKLVLATRRSLLAWGQSSWVARRVEEANPGVIVELLGIETQGDKIQDIPLSQVDGKEFFVKELDEALLSGRADFTVHSMKDLSLDRPQGIALAAIPKREDARDAVIFGPGVVEKLKQGQPLRVGSSSPRRIENIPSFLEKALPLFIHKPRVEFLEIRGNVNTRLSRLHEPEGSAKHLDAVVLALAGLNRLYGDSAGREAMNTLLQGVRWMILPLTLCPAAPAQGALAIEARSTDLRTLAALAKLHDPKTERLVKQERAILRLWGGGCHQRFGATAIEHAELGDCLFIRGRKPPEFDNEFVEEIRYGKPEQPKRARLWIGSKWRLNEKTGEIQKPNVNAMAVFVAHSRALNGELPKETRIWTSGTQSWLRLAERGHWVEGCADSLGFDSIAATLQTTVLQLPEPKNWVVLTHEDAVETWDQTSWPAKVIGTYKVTEAKPSEAQMVVAELAQATHLYWSSGSQFERLKKHIRNDAVHACGPGKTAKFLREKGVSKVFVFPSAEEFQKWASTSVD